MIYKKEYFLLIQESADYQLVPRIPAFSLLIVKDQPEAPGLGGKEPAPSVQKGHIDPSEVRGVVVNDPVIIGQQ